MTEPARCIHRMILHCFSDGLHSPQTLEPALGQEVYTLGVRAVVKVKWDLGLLELKFSVHT